MEKRKSKETEITVPSMSNGNTVSRTSSKNTTSYPKDDKAGCCRKDGCLRENILTILTFFSVVVGIALGFALRQSREWTKREIMYLNFPGEIFLRMLKGLILPLIVSSLVSALGGLDIRLSGRIGARAVAYYLLTTVVAIIMGIVLVMSIRPGDGESMGKSAVPIKSKPSLTEDTLMDLIRNMFPPNIIEACIHQYSTVLEKPKYFNVTVDNTTQDNEITNVTQSKNETANVTKDLYTWEISNKMGGGTNILGLVVFSVVLGITLGRMMEAGKPLLDVFTAMSDAMMIITRLVIWLSPVGVLFLVAGKILEMEDLSVVVGQVGLYTATVLAGLFIHGCVTLPLIYFLIVRRQPFNFMLNMTQALATAFGTSSSSATLPVTISCLEDKNGIDPRVARFVLPVGATINMDGTALYEAVAAIFIAQIRKVNLSLGNIIAISITATAASIGAAGIPQAGLVTMVMVLNVVGLPADDIALIFVVDWFLDRFRTTVNVLGDAFGAGIVAHLSAKDLATLQHEDDHHGSTPTLEMTPL